MRRLYIRFLAFLRDLFAESVELINEELEVKQESPSSVEEEVQVESKGAEVTVVVVDGAVMVNNVTLDMEVKQGDNIITYRRTPKRTPKYDIKLGKTTFYAWGKGEVYTNTLEGENIPVVTNPSTDYTLVGYGTIL